MYSIVPILCLASAALAAPQRPEFVPILSQSFNGPLGPNYDFQYEGADGTRRDESGQAAFSDGSGPSVSQGSWSFTFPDGSPGRVDFVADVSGFQARSDRLPVAPPMPPHALEQLARAERERAQGIFHGGQWDAAQWGHHNYQRK